jgi:hypothetical protein
MLSLLLMAGKEKCIACDVLSACHVLEKAYQGAFAGGQILLYLLHQISLQEISVATLDQLAPKM